jgi:nucleoside-diphosphate-sugar epimerase
MTQLQKDLDDILLHTKSLWSDVSNKTIFITGGTGFFGKWLLHSFVHINNQLNLNNKLIVLTRNKRLFLEKNPFFKNLKDLDFIDGDVRDFVFPDEKIHYIIHAATEASASLNLDNPLLMYDTIVEGTKRVLELGRAKNVSAILHTSSGAVYGKQPPEITHISENYAGCPDIYAPDAAYAEGKRVAEMMAVIYYEKYGLPSKIARCFAFVGPYLPLNGHFAIGNFIDDVLHNKDIFVSGDGTPYRSYLYSSDLTIWLWTILFKGKPSQPYNVGSDEDLTIEQLARIIVTYNLVSNVKIALQNDENGNSNRYVPSIEKAKKELGLCVKVHLKDAISNTLQFFKYDTPCVSYLKNRASN